VAVWSDFNINWASGESGKAIPDETWAFRELVPREASASRSRTSLRRRSSSVNGAGLKARYVSMCLHTRILEAVLCSVGIMAFEAFSCQLGFQGCKNILIEPVFA